MRRLLLTIGVGVVIVVGVVVAGVSAAAPATQRVTIQNFAFSPARLVVSPGTRVVWTNRDSAPHTVKTDGPGFSSPVLNTGSTYAVVMRRTGTFAYYCTIHPFMQGTIVVRR